MKDAQFDELIKRLDRITRILLFKDLNNLQTKKEKIIHLHSLGFQPIEIVNLVGTTRAVVDNTLSKARKSGETE